MSDERGPEGRKPGPGWTRRFFIFGVTVTAAVLLIASLIPDPVVGDPRPIVAVLPLFYATVMIAGVAWFAWWALRRR